MSRKRVELYEEVLPDGRCNYRLPYVDRMTGKNKKLSVIMPSQSASNYKLALRTLQTKLDKIMTEADGTEGQLGELIEMYLSERAKQIKPSTLKRNSFALEQCCKVLGADVYVSQLTLPYVKNNLQKQMPKAVTYNENIKRFKSFLRWCYINDYLPDQKLADKLVAMPDNRQERITDKYLEKDELMLLLDAAEHDLWRFVTHFLALSGMRVGELIALQNSDIDDEYIHVQRTYEISVSKLSDMPKTSSSIRDIYLRPELKKLVSEIQSYMRIWKFERGIRSDLFICSENGTYMNYNSYRKWLKENSEDILGRKITPHALRHTTASLLIADGVPLEVVSRMLGHDGSKITKQIYIHITQELKNRDKEILSRASLLG